MHPVILLATDGKPGALGAARLALDAAAVHRARVEVVAVHDPSPLLMGFDDPFLSSYAAHEMEAVEALRERVQAQLREVGGVAPSWRVSVKRGPVAPMIARAAGEASATLIVLGLHHYSTQEHWIGRETPLRVMHLAHVPVLAVPPAATALPSRVVIATDFGAVSLGAARDARALAAPGAALHLANVIPTEGEPGGPLDHAVKGSYQAMVKTRLAEIAVELTRGDSGRTCVHVLSGDAGSAVLELAEGVGAEMIAVGSQSYSLFERLLLGSVPSRVVRGASCAVLVAPSLHVSSDLRRNLIEAELLAHLGYSGAAAARARPLATLAG
jgi:nucleotide-binding universal stress UspA family protein